MLKEIPDFFDPTLLTKVSWVCYLLYVALAGLVGFCFGYALAEENRQILQEDLVVLEAELAKRDMEIRVLHQRPENRQQIDIPLENW